MMFGLPPGVYPPELPIPSISLVGIADGSLGSNYSQTLTLVVLEDTTMDIGFLLPAAAVTQKLLLALESQKPATSYYITKPTYFMALMRRILPISWLERLLAAI